MAEPCYLRAATPLWATCSILVDASAGNADGPDELAAYDERNASGVGDHAGEPEHPQVVATRSQGILKHLCRPPEQRRGTRFSSESSTLAFWVSCIFSK